MSTEVNSLKEKLISQKSKYHIENENLKSSQKIVENLELQLLESKKNQNELSNKLETVETLQKEKVDNIGERLELTINEIKILSEENNQLRFMLNEETKRKEEMVTKADNFKHKYENKKLEAKALRNKCEKFGKEIIQLQSQNNEAINYLSEQRFKKSKNENKSKVNYHSYRQLKKSEEL